MKLICFDLDNTIVNNDKAHVLAYNHALSKFGLKRKSYKNITKLFGRPHIDLVRLIAPNLSEKKLYKLMYLHDDILIKYTYKYTKSIKNVKRILKKLKNNYNLAVLSNCSHKTILASLKGAKINRKLFNYIIGNDDVKRSKPWPDEILKAENLEHRKASFMVGDSIYDIIAGKKAKVSTIAVLTGSASKRKLMKYNPDYIIKSINELPKLLKKIDKN